MIYDIGAMDSKDVLHVLWLLKMRIRLHKDADYII